MSVTNGSEKILICIPYIYYLVQFRLDKDNIQALINLGSKVNAMNFAYTKKLGLYIRQNDVKAQKIEGSHLEIFDMVIASFLL